MPSIMENPFEKTISDKELRRQKIEDEVEHITDGLGKPIDGGIKESVIVFKLAGFTTHFSCEGHVERGLPYPFVDIVAPTRSDIRFKELQDKYKQDGFLIPAEMEEGLSLEAKIAKEEQEIKDQLDKLLDEFNEKHGGENGMAIKKYASWYRIQPVGAGEFDAARPKENDLTAKERQRRTEFLDKTQKQMKNLVTFLSKTA